MFVFTSSGGIFAEEDGGVVTEESPVKDTSRAGMLKSESYDLRTECLLIQQSYLRSEQSAAYRLCGVANTYTGVFLVSITPKRGQI